MVPVPRTMAMSLSFLSQHACYGITVQEICLFDEVIELATPPEKLGRGVEFSDGTPIQDHNAIRVNDGIDSVGDGDDCAILENAAA